MRNIKERKKDDRKKKGKYSRRKKGKRRIE